MNALVQLNDLIEIMHEEFFNRLGYGMFAFVSLTEAANIFDKENFNNQDDLIKFSKSFVHNFKN